MVERGGNVLPAYAEFLTYLRQKEFEIGVSHYVRLHGVFERLGEEIPPEKLKTLICPLVATSDSEQARFYKAFDEYVAHVQESVGIYPPPPPPNGRPKGWPAFAAAWLSRYQPWLHAAVNSLVALAFLLTAYAMSGAPPVDSQTVTAEAAGGAAEASVTPAVTPTETVTPSPPTGTPPGAAPTAEQPDAPEGATQAPAVGAGDILYFLLLLAAGCLFIFAAYKLYYRLRRRIVARQAHKKSPPYSWPVTAPSKSHLYNSEDYNRAARLLRRRVIGDFQRLDVGATVAATIKALGYLNLRFKPFSKIPEYLLLIERASARDHQAQLFASLAKELAEDGLFVTHYFYGSDARVLYREVSKAGASQLQYRTSKELQLRHQGHRLLIFGSGHDMIDRLTGKLAPWSKAFSAWQERALLTPEEFYGARELILEEEFAVLPATTRSLGEAADFFESPAEAHARPRRARGRDGYVANPRNINDVLGAEGDARTKVEALRRYLGPEVFQWLCACAIYPELHWELTLQIRQLACTGEDVFQEESLLRLFNLKWFRQGAIPDDCRWLLLESLEPERARAVRAALIDILRAPHNHPPEETYAAAASRLHVLAQEWLLRRGRESYRRLLQFLRALPLSSVFGDQTLLRLLRGSRDTLVSRVVPDRYRPFVYRHGIPGFGPGLGFLLAVFLLVSVACFLVYLSLATPTGGGPFGDNSNNLNANANANANTNTNANTNAGNTNAGNTNAGNTNAGNTNVGNTNVGNLNPANSNSGIRNTNAGTNTNGGNANGGGNRNSGGNSNGSSGRPLSPLPAYFDRSIFREWLAPGLNSDDEDELLGNELVPVLKNNPGATVSLIYYNALDKADRVRSRLINEQAIDASRIRVVDGGASTIEGVDIQVLPAGSAAGLITLPRSAEKIGESNYATSGSGETEITAANVEGLINALRTDPTARGYVVLNRIHSDNNNIFHMRSVTELFSASGIDASRVTVVIGQGTGRDLELYQVGEGRLPRKIDEYGNVGFGDEKARLDNFAVELQNDPVAQGYLICYGGRRGRAGEAQARCDRAKNYLVTARAIDESRIVLVDGGYKEELMVEVWFVPQGAQPPEASPTVDPSEVVPARRPRRRR